MWFEVICIFPLAIQRVTNYTSEPEYFCMLTMPYTDHLIGSIVSLQFGLYVPLGHCSGEIMDCLWYG